MNRRTTTTTTTATVVVATVAALTLSACGSSDTAAIVASATNATETSALAVTQLDTTEANRRTMERFTSEFLPTGDPALAEQFLSPDVVLHFGGQELRGRDTYLSVVAANGDTFGDLVWTVEGMVADGDTVAVRYTLSGIHQGEFAGVAPTGRAVTAQSMAFYKLAEGRIVEERAQLDINSLLQQMGAS